MKKEIKKLCLPEGEFDVEVLIFEDKDRKHVASIYKNWRQLCNSLEVIESRKMNIPEGLSETAICIEMGWYRVNNPKKASGFKSSFDCYDPKYNKRIQIKATSIEEDLSSFGPKSVWDVLCFLDFYRSGKWDGQYDYYKIDFSKIYNIVLNKDKGETFADQQLQGRRPRLSIKKCLIKKESRLPTKTFLISP